MELREIFKEHPSFKENEEENLAKADKLRRFVQHRMGKSMTFEGFLPTSSYTRFVLKSNIPGTLRFWKTATSKSTLEEVLQEEIQCMKQSGDKLFIDVKHKKYHTLGFLDAIDNGEILDEDEGLQFLVGQTPDGEWIKYNFLDSPHLLIGASSGSGKTSLLNQMLCTLMYKNSPEDLNVYVIDKKTELLIYKNAPHVKAAVDTVEDGINILDSLTEIAEDRRKNIFKKEGVLNITAYNKKSAEKLPYIICVIDEMDNLLMNNRKGSLEEVFTKKLEASIKINRSAGIYFVISAQQCTSAIFPPQISSQLTGRVALKVGRTADSVAIINASNATKLNGKGDALFRNGNELVRLQVPYITDDETLATIEWLKKEV